MPAANPPTVTSMRLKFPPIASASDSDIAFAIEEAGVSIDKFSWLANEDALAQSYLAAHYLMLAISTAESATGEQTVAETIGRISIRFAARPQPSEGDPGDFVSTPYGVRFLELCRLNFGLGILVI